MRMQICAVEAVWIVDVVAGWRAVWLGRQPVVERDAHRLTRKDLNGRRNKRNFWRLGCAYVTIGAQPHSIRLARRRIEDRGRSVFDVKIEHRLAARRRSPNRCD